MRSESVFNRRRILIGAAVFGIAGAERGRGAGAYAGQEAAKLPATIKALESMRDAAKPITAEERRARVSKAQRLMTEHKLDAMVLAGGTSLQYFTGIRWGNSERMFAAVIPVAGRAFCVCPAFEEDRAHEQLNKGPLEDAAVLAWQEDESPYKLIAAGLRALGRSTGTVGVEERMPQVFSDEMAKAAPALHFTSATAVTAGCRMIKSAHELDLMRVANRATLKVYEAVYRALTPGLTQDEVSQWITAAYARVGFRGEASVETGPATALPHGSEKPQVIGEDAIVMIDDGCLVEGYNSDITRTFVLGKPSDKMQRAFNLVRRAQTVALAAARPGVACETVDAAARKVIVDGGFGPDYKFFSHRVGHGIGMDGHEWPYLVRGNKLPMQANMTFSDEPGVYLRGEFGMRLEDDMYVTDSGAELFTPQSASLEHPFG